METLRRAGANVLGIVLNRVPTKSDLAYGGYYGNEPAADAGGQGAASAATSSSRSTS
jgi:hypothetical protein